VDSVTLSLGQVVLCAVNGANGYVIGSLNGTIRAESAWYELGYNNPQAPDYKGLDTYTLELPPTSVGVYLTTGTPRTTNITGAAEPYSINTSTSIAYVSWYYGNGAFAPIAGQAISKIELRLRINAIPTAGAVLQSHTEADYSTTTPTFTALSYSASVISDTWVDVTSLVTLDGSNFGFSIRAAAGSNPSVFTEYAQAPYGTIRVTYTK